MSIQELNTEKLPKSWISLTGYRILIILKSLMESGKTIDELITILKNDEITDKSVSKDTVRVAINTLKSAGCEIGRPSKANNYKYELYSHLFNLKISEEEWHAFIKLRERIADTVNRDDIFIINDLYTKIVSLTENPILMEEVKNSSPLGQLNKKIFIEITNPALLGKKLNIKYLSPSFGEENIEIILKKVAFENGRIYLYCFNLKYNSCSMLNLERVLKINSVSIHNMEISNNFTYDVVYEITGNSAQEFDLNENEEIISENQDKIRVKAVVDNEFHFIQRILLFGSEFSIISPDFFREKLINKIRLIQKGYEQ